MTLITSGRKCLGLRGGRAHRGASPAGSCAPPPSVTQTCPCTPGGCLARPAPGLRVFPFSGADLSMPCLLVRSQGWVSLAATEAVRGEKRVDTGGVRTEWGARPSRSRPLGRRLVAKRRGLQSFRPQGLVVP